MKRKASNSNRAASENTDGNLQNPNALPSSHTQDSADMPPPKWIPWQKPRSSNKPTQQPPLASMMGAQSNPQFGTQPISTGVNRYQLSQPPSSFLQMNRPSNPSLSAPGFVYPGTGAHAANTNPMPTQGYQTGPALQQQQQQQQQQLDINSLGIGCYSDGGQPIKEWQKTTTPDIRNQMILKILEYMQSARANSWLDQMKDVERQTYMSSNSLEEYYQNMTEHIHRVSSHHEQRERQEAAAQPGLALQHQQDPSSGPSYSSPSSTSLSSLDPDAKVETIWSAPPAWHPPPGAAAVPVSMAFQLSKMELEDLRKEEQHNKEADTSTSAEHNPGETPAHPSPKQPRRM